MSHLPLKNLVAAELGKVTFSMAFALTATVAWSAEPGASATVTISPFVNLTQTESVSGSGTVASVSTEFSGATAQGVSSSRSASASGSTDGWMSASASAAGPGIANLTSGFSGTSQWISIEGLPAGASITGRLRGSFSGTLNANTTPTSTSIAVSSFHYSVRVGGASSTNTSGGLQMLSESGLVSTRESGSMVTGKVSLTATPTLYFDALGSPKTATPTVEDLARWGISPLDSNSYNFDSDSFEVIDGDIAFYSTQVLALALGTGFAGINLLPEDASVGIGMDVTYRIDGEADLGMEFDAGRRNIILTHLDTNANSGVGGNSFAAATFGVAADGSSSQNGFFWSSFVVPSDTQYDLSDVFLQIEGGGVIPVVLAVPEPSRALLFGSGLAFLFAVLRRRLNQGEKA